jgi:outer membrane protein TolC
LNRPDPLNNFRAAVSVSQSIYEGGRNVASSRQAGAASALAESTRAEAQRGIAVAVTQSYVSVLVSEAAARAAQSAVDSAVADENLATDRRDVGMATEADVLSLSVHRSEMQARQITAAGDARIARATLNRLIGAPLDRDWLLESAPEPAPLALDVSALETEALASRPDIRSAGSMIDLAQASRDATRAALLPEVGLEGGYEWNGAQWATRSPSWIVGVQARFSLSLGGAERAETRAAALGVDRARAVRESVQAAARLEVRAAVARLESAHARVEVARSSVEQARESERIVRDRYEAGLAGVTDLLRVSNSLVDATARLAAADGDVTVARVLLDRAVGRLPEVSP